MELKLIQFFLLNNSRYGISFSLILLTMFHAYLSQQNTVAIKSHKVSSSEGLTYNQISSIYDNNVDTSGSFYSSNDQNAEVEFDLQKNYLIDYVLIRIKREDNILDLNISVGNSFERQERLLYTCKRLKESEDIYKCQSICILTNVPRPGIIARKFIMQLKVSNKWISIYEMQVFSRPVTLSEDISSYRLIYPEACNAKSWLLTDRTTNSSTPTTTTTILFFEKSYIVTEFHLKFDSNSPKTFEFMMTNHLKKNKTVKISLSDCSLENFQFTCKLSEEIFSATQLTIYTVGLMKIFIKGKPVFYPKLDLETSFTEDAKLRITCTYTRCDLSVHSDCSDATMKGGRRFECVNRRLVRLPTSGDQDSYVIVDKGQVEPTWRSTKFSVDVNNEDRMVVSAPRSYQYFGQYQCGCIVADSANSEIMSNKTKLSEIYFLEDLFFDKNFQYKLTESSDLPYRNVSNNVILLPMNTTNFFPLKITMYSLMKDNLVNIIFPESEKGFETIQINDGVLHSVKAFSNITQSWFVTTYKYAPDDIYPVPIHDRNISIECSSPKSILQQKEFIKLLYDEKVRQKPAIWIDGDNKVVKTNIMYGGMSEAKLYYNESTCTGASTTILASFTKNTCSSKDQRLTCVSFDNAYLLIFKDGLSFSKDRVIYIVNSTDRTTVASYIYKANVTLKQGDAIVKPRFTRITSSLTDTSINVVRLELNVISKKIDDFILCGNVLVTISFINGSTKSMVLQKSVFFEDIEMTSAVVTILITITIKNVKGSHVTNIQVIDPTSFGASSVQFQEEKTLRLVWTGIDEIAIDLLQSFEVNITSTIVACNHTTVEVIPKDKVFQVGNRYHVTMPAVNGNHITTYSVTIQPVYHGGKRGRLERVDRQSGTMGPSSVLVSSTEKHRSQFEVTVISSQTDLPCNSKDTVFTVTGIDVEKRPWERVALDNMKYRITGLVPGRKYQLTAKVVYEHGPDDLTSQSHTLETADDVSILKKKHVAELNEFINITCTADVGPNDQYQKSVKWLRADSSPLPAGVQSVTSQFDRKVAFLVMDKASADYSGEYSCLAYPPAKSGWMTISIVVNDLVVHPTKKLVDFNDKSEPVSVTCSSSAVERNDLVWSNPLGNVIDEKSMDKYSIKRTMTEQNVFKSILTIKEMSLNTSGIYKCTKAIGDIQASREFLLYGREVVVIEQLANSSNFIGEKLRLRCSGQPGLSSQTVSWTPKAQTVDEVVLITTSFPFPGVRTTQDIHLVNSLLLHRVTCSLHPAIEGEQESKTHQISLKSKIVVDGPAEVKAGTKVTLTCLGYPDKMDMQLKWIFYPTNKTSDGKVISTSEKSPKSKPYEPIKLSLNITDVKNDQGGRYECKFLQAMTGRVMQPSRSITLVVNSEFVSIPFIDPKKSADSLFASNKPITFIFVTLTLFIVNNRLV